MASVMIPADVGLELETGVALAANADFHRIEFTAADHEGLGSRLFAESDLSLSWQQKVVETGHRAVRSEEHTSELQSLMRISYAVFCLKKKKKKHTHRDNQMKNTNNSNTDSKD